MVSSEPKQWLDSLQRLGIALGLGRTRALLRAMGSPHRAYPSVIVAGTNGKGSTAATLASILSTSGYATGLYISPPLIDERERWTIDGVMISPDDLDDTIRSLRAAAERIAITPTYFEALTLIAFLVFAKQRCDVVVLEVGMGGRLDATNVVRPLASVITPIGLDHVGFLGNTLRKIAREKAGIIHRGAIVLTSNRDEGVLNVIRKRAAKFGSEVIVVHGEHPTPLQGDFQPNNVALAVRTAEELRTKFPRITSASIERGVRETRWRGRLERFAINGKTIVVDGCHNAHAARAVAPYIERTLPKPRLLVFGIMGDKDVSDVIDALFPLFDRVIATEPYPPRSLSAHEIPGAIPEPDMERALKLALDAEERSVFVGGSLYLAGAALAFLDARIE